MTAPSIIGIHFRASGKKGDGLAYHFTIAPFSNKYYQILSFGKNTTPDKWNNFIVTFSSTAGLCAYINGEKSSCSSQSYSATVSTHAHRFKIGYNWDSSVPTEMFVDDFAIWRTAFSAEKVKEIYKDGAK